MDPFLTQSYSLSQGGRSPRLAASPCLCLRYYTVAFVLCRFRMPDVFTIKGVLR